MLSVLMVEFDGACLYNLHYKSLTISVPIWLDEILGFILHSHLRPSSSDKRVESFSLVQL